MNKNKGFFIGLSFEFFFFFFKQKNCEFCEIIKIKLN